MFPIKPFTNVIKAKPRSLILIAPRFLNQTHYDVLGLSKNCTNKDIKNAFISLSKRFHPDKAQGEGSHKEFVKILEAYNVLSKPESRNLYNWELSSKSSHISKQRPGFYSTQTTRTWGHAYDNPSFWKSRGYADKDDENYYGIPGIRRVSNEMVATVCIVLAIVVGILQFYAIRYSMTLRRDLLIKHSEAYSNALAKIEAEKNNRGKDEQIEYMEKQLLENYKSNSH